MAQYFFDFEEDERFENDETGVDCLDRDAVRKVALRALAEVARDKYPNGDHSDLTISVRDAAGSYVFQARMTLRAGWISDGLPKLS